MRQSPTRVVFNYSGHREDPPLYSPQLIHSGYIVGEPVAYTEHPQLPPNFQSFSPKRPRAITSAPLNQSVRYNRNSFESKYEAPDPAIFAPPLRQSFRGNTSQRGDSVSLEEYNSLRQKYGELERKYRLLEEKYERATAEKGDSRGTFSNEQFANWITKLIELYKQNTIKESHLLIDRLRL
jgi:hypothetical protein